MPSSIRDSLFVLVGFALSASGRQTVTKPKDIPKGAFCVEYPGSVRADLELPDTVPEYSANGSVRCPSQWAFPAVRGARFEICPATSGGLYKDYGRSVEVSLTFQDYTENVTLPVQDLVFDTILITDGSEPGPFYKNGEPAILAPDKAASDETPFWTINGTQRALNGISGDGSVGFSCDDMRDTSDSFCGYGRKDDCWRDQSFEWNMESRLNFTFRFSNSNASVELWTAEEFYRDEYEGTGTGSPTHAYLKFEGTRDFPDKNDEGFWANYPEGYQAVQNDPNQIELVPDENGMPIFMNKTSSPNWYASGNQTFSVSRATTMKGTGLMNAIPSIVVGLGATLLLV